MAATSTTASPPQVPHRRLDNFLFGLGLFNAILLVPMAAFVVWAVWPRPQAGDGDIGAAARGYAVIADLFVMVIVWLIGLVATLSGKAMETRPERRRGFNRLTMAYLGWVAPAGAYLWYCQVA